MFFVYVLSGLSLVFFGISIWLTFKKKKELKTAKGFVKILEGEKLKPQKIEYKALPIQNDDDPVYLQEIWQFAENPCIQWLFDSVKSEITNAMVQGSSARSETLAYALQNNLTGVQMVLDKMNTLHNKHITQLQSGEHNGEV
jgi:hypothetical protein